MFRGDITAGSTLVLSSAADRLKQQRFIFSFDIMNLPTRACLA